MVEPKLVMIEWVDSVQPYSAWLHFNELPVLEAVLCKSVGWLVGENTNVKMLAPNVGDLHLPSNSQGSGFIRIPVAAITRLVELTEKP